MRLLKQAYYQHEWYFIKKYLTKLNVYITLMAMAIFKTLPNGAEALGLFKDAAQSLLNTHRTDSIAALTAGIAWVSNTDKPIESLVIGAIVGLGTSLASVGSEFVANCLDLIDDKEQALNAQKAAVRAAQKAHRAAKKDKANWKPLVL